jgi:beta-lactamase superfamily II metal-dependent hydrolase
MTLGIHVIGAGFGESIVVELPNGGIGLIDCFSSSLSPPSPGTASLNPTLRFLRDDLHADRLTFVAFTHPHEDHGRGLSHILDVYHDRIDQVWVFPALGSIALERYFRAIRSDGLRLPGEKLCDDPPGTFYRELLRIHQAITEQCLKPGTGRARLVYFSAERRPIDLPGGVQAHFIAPTSVVGARYSEALSENIRNIVIRDENTPNESLIMNDQWQPDDVNHNLVSAGIVLAYGSTRVVLGGDLEQPSWEAALASRRTNEKGVCPLTCRLIKVSHHGSSNGYTETLYSQHLVGRSRPIGILTPYNRHSRPLPTANGLQGITPWVSELYATNLLEAELARDEDLTGLGAASTAPPAIPASWLYLLRKNPGWQVVLHPSLTKTSEVAPPPEIPVEMVPLLGADPTLADCLHPLLRRQWKRQQESPITAPEHECRASFFFNRRGQELKSRRYIGSRAGRLSQPC